MQWYICPGSPCRGLEIYDEGYQNLAKCHGLMLSEGHGTATEENVSQQGISWLFMDVLQLY